MDIQKLCLEAHSNAIDKGFYEIEETVPNNNTLAAILVSDKLMSLIEEVMEIRELLQHGKTPVVLGNACHYEDIKGTIAEELADVWIRLGSLTAQLHQTDTIEGIISIKMKYNKTRPYKHGKVF